MKLRYALIAEYANVTGDGKLNILGVSDRLFAYQFPATHRDLFVIDSIETDNEDDGTSQEVTIQVIHSDGGILSEIRGAVQIEGLRQVFNQVHVFQDIIFPNAGAYQVSVFFGSELVQAMDLELILIQGQQFQNN